MKLKGGRKKQKQKLSGVLSAAPLFPRRLPRWMFNLAQILRRMPFLMKPSHLYRLGTGMRSTLASL